MGVLAGRSHRYRRLSRHPRGVGVAALILLLGLLGFAAPASAHSAASQPLGLTPDAVILNQGSGCPTNTTPCATVWSPSVRFGQPLPTNCLAIGAPFPYQQCIDTTASPPILKEFIGSAWYPVATLSPTAGYLPLFGSVPSEAVLATRTIANYPQGVWRSDYAVGNGAEPMLYLPSNAACPINSGAGDGGSQVPSADGKCWIAQPPEQGYDVKEFGARGNCSTDDSAAFQAAGNTGAPVRIGNGHFLINTGVAFSGLVRFTGIGFTTAGLADGVCGTDKGSYLVTTATSTSAVTLNGLGPSGSQFKNFAVIETQPSPGGGWAPTVYQPFFTLNSTSNPLTDVSFDQIGAGAIYDLIAGQGNAARLVVDNLWGQVFHTALFVDDAQDTSSAHDWHLWPYWSSDSNVLNWQYAHSLPIRFLRQDGFQGDNIFIFGAKACIDLAANTTEVAGGPSGIQFGNVWCDAGMYAVWIEASPIGGASIAISHLRAGGETVAGTPIAGGNTIEVDGQSATISIGDILDNVRAGSVLNLTNNAVGSIINIGSIQVQNGFNFAGSVACGGTLPVLNVAAISGGIYASEINIDNYVQPSGCAYDFNSPNNFQNSGLINPTATADLRAFAGQNWAFQQIGNGATQQIPLWVESYYLYAPGTLASATLNLPFFVNDGRTVNVFCGMTITALTITPPVGEAILGGGPTSCQLGQVLTFKFNVTEQNWWWNGTAGGGGGGGGVNPGTAGQVAWYAATGAMLSGLPALTYNSGSNTLSFASDIAAGTVTSEVLNNDTANNTAADLNVVVGGTNTYITLGESRFTGTPGGFLTTGAGDTGGMGLQSLSGPITLLPATFVNIPTLTPSSAVCTDASNNLVSGSCGSGGGGVSPGVAGQLAYYAATGSTVSGLPALTFTAGTLSFASTLAGGTLTSEALNNSASNNSVSGFSAVTGGTNTYVSLQESEFTGSPGALLTSGTGNTAGIAIQSLAGAITINPATTVRIPTLTPSTSVCTDASSNLVSGTCGSGGGGVNTGVAGQITYYAATGASVSGLPALTYTSGLLSFSTTAGGGTVTSEILNGSSANSSVAALNVVTGGANAFISVQQNQFTGLPGGTLQTGTGDTGGLGIQSLSGPITIRPATSINLPTLAASSGLCTDGSKNLTTSGCASGGSGTVNTGSGGTLAYYATTGTAVSGLAALAYSPSSPELTLSGSLSSGAMEMEILNGATGGSTNAALLLVTGSGGANLYLLQDESSGTPGASITSGGGDTGGLALISSAGPVTILAGTAVVMPNLSPSSHVCTDGSKNLISC
jgi:hypothetical protein